MRALEAGLDEYLRSAMRDRGWHVPRLAEECDVSIGLAAKWVSENPRYRVNPGPASCEKIAAALGVDADEVLVIAGHRKPRPSAQQDEMDPIEQAIRARTAEMREAVRGTPQSMWATIIRKTFDTAIVVARDLAEMAGAEVSDTAGSALNEKTETANEPKPRPGSSLSPRQLVTA